MLADHGESAFRQLATAMAGPEPLPAGGAAAVTAIAMGLGLGAKVIRISSTGSTAAEPTRRRLEELLDRALPEFASDCDAFAELLAVMRRPRDDGGRDAALAEAWREATWAPVTVARIAREGEELLSTCSDLVKPSMRGDLAAALELVRAGRRIAVGNARENAQRLDAASAEVLLARLVD